MILGKCAHCGADIVLVAFRTEGWRYCWGCERRGAEAVLTSEVRQDVPFISVVDIHADDPTAVSCPSDELLEAAGR